VEGEGVSFIINQGQFISNQFMGMVGIGFLIAMGLMLFQSQMGIYDGASRIIAENYAILKTREEGRSEINLSQIYYIFLWGQIALGIILFALDFSDPVVLVTLAAVINAVSMFVHIGLVNWTNWRLLPKQVHPHWLRKLLMLIIFIIFGVFSVISVWQNIF
jgi:hypothetical protein